MLDKAALRIYRSLVLLYSEEYRNEFGDDMVTTFSDLVEETREGQGPIGVIALIILSTFDILLQSARDRLRTSKQRGMSHFQPTNPVRGSKLFLLLSGITVLVLSLVPSVQEHFDLRWLSLIFVVLLVPLLVRSQRSWGLSIFSAAFTYASSLVLAQILQYSMNLGWYSFIFEKLFGPDWYTNPISHAIDQFMMALFEMAPLVLAGWLMIREVEGRVVARYWERISQKVEDGGTAVRKKLVRRYVFLVILGVILGCGALVFASRLEISTILRYGVDTGQSPYLYFIWPLGSLYSKPEGWAVLLVGLAGLMVTVGLGWVLSRKKLLWALAIGAVFAGSFAGIGTWVERAFSVQFSNQELSNEEGLAIAESCAAQGAQDSTLSIQEIREADYLKGDPPANVDMSLCGKYMTERRVGNTIYESGYGSSVDWQTGQAVNFTITTYEVTPLLDKLSKPFVKLGFIMAFAFVVPGLISALSVVLLERLTRK